MKFIEKYYPVLLALISFFLSVSLWFSGEKDQGLYVGLWVPSILCFGIFIELTKKQ